MGATNSFRSEVLRHILLNEAITNLGDTGGLLPSVAPGDVYLALLTQDPGDPGDLTNESAFGGYARLAVARGATEWSEVDGIIKNLNNLTFAACTDGSETVTHFGICKSLAGDDMIFSGALPAPALVAIEVEIRFEPNYLAVNMN